MVSRIKSKKGESQQIIESKREKTISRIEKSKKRKLVEKSKDRQLVEKQKRHLVEKQYQLVEKKEYTVSIVNINIKIKGFHIN